MLFALRFRSKICSQKGSKIVIFELQNRSIFGPKWGFKNGKLKDQKCASHCSQKQNREIRQGPGPGWPGTLPSLRLPPLFHQYR